MQAPLQLQLEPGIVDLWQIPLAGQEGRIANARRLLSFDEIERAERFYFEQHRIRFIAARSAMRTVLSQYLDIVPQEVAFTYGARGKPALEERLQRSSLEFNLSHSGDFALLAVTRQAAMGVDIEAINHEFATQEIAERFFSSAEVETLSALAPEQRAKAFFHCWTRKEAYIKAVGDGLYIPLDSFDVAFAPGVPAALLRTNDPRQASRWSMHDIRVPEGYAGALVVEGRDHRLRQLHWTAP